jgi:hypothetical protein
MKTQNRLKLRQSGQIFGVLVILIVLLAVGLWLLFAYKNSMAKEGRDFANEAMQKIVIQHDVNFLSNRLSPQGRLDNPPSARQEMISSLQQLGTLLGPLQVQGDIKFQSQFFEPRGYFNAQLNYPTRSGRLDISVSHPVGRWQIDTITLTFGKER